MKNGFGSGRLVDVREHPARIDAHGHDWGNGWEVIFHDGIVVQVLGDPALWDSPSDAHHDACVAKAKEEAIRLRNIVLASHNLVPDDEPPRIELEWAWGLRRPPVVFMYEVQDDGSGIMYRFRGKNGLEAFGADFVLSGEHQHQHLNALSEMIPARMAAKGMSDRLVDATQIVFPAKRVEPVAEYRSPAAQAEQAKHNAAQPRLLGMKGQDRLPTIFTPEQAAALERQIFRITEPMQEFLSPTDGPPMRETLEEHRRRLQMEDLKRRVMSWLEELCAALGITAEEGAAAMDVMLLPDDQIECRTHDKLVIARGSIKPPIAYENPPIELTPSKVVEHPQLPSPTAGLLELD